MSESGAEKLSKTKKLSGSSPSSKASRRKRRDSKQPEIESGVEMHEDTILMAPANSNRKLTESGTELRRSSKVSLKETLRGIGRIGKGSAADLNLSQSDKLRNSTNEDMDNDHFLTVTNNDRKEVPPKSSIYSDLRGGKDKDDIDNCADQYDDDPENKDDCLYFDDDDENDDDDDFEDTTGDDEIYSEELKLKDPNLTFEEKKKCQERLQTLRNLQRRKRRFRLLKEIDSAYSLEDETENRIRNLSATYHHGISMDDTLLIGGSKQNNEKQMREMLGVIVADHKSRKGFVVSLIEEVILNTRYLPTFSLLGLLLSLIIPAHDFLRGVLTTIFTVIIMECIIKFVTCIVGAIMYVKPEGEPFRIPDYNNMSICEIPAAKEFQTVKSYEGWMNEIESYDPDNYHISMTRSVYVKLDGSMLYILSTNARINKRATWNENLVDIKTVPFTSQRIYDLFQGRVDLLPIGLARKRHFNRKYPIQLIAKNCIEQQPIKVANTRNSHHHIRFGFRRKAEKQDQQPKNTIEKVNSSILTEDDKSQENAENSVYLSTLISDGDLTKLRDEINPDDDLKKLPIPTFDETRILLFARADREKEDWFRRFWAASVGNVADHELNIPNSRKIEEDTLKGIARAMNVSHLNKPKETDNVVASEAIDSSHDLQGPSTSKDVPNPVSMEHKENDNDADMDAAPEINSYEPSTIEGILMSACVARNDPAYVHFMSIYQKACNQTQIPVYRNFNTQHARFKRRKRDAEHDVWKGVDQSLFLGPSGSVVWFNILVGRLLFSALQNPIVLEKIQSLFQKKLNALKLPSFMEDVNIKTIELGDKPPLIHRVSQPLLNERGIWIDADVTYNGRCHITITTRLNLLRLKRPPRPLVDPIHPTEATPDTGIQLNASLNSEDRSTPYDNVSNSAIFDSDAESLGSSSSESEGAHPENTPDTQHADGSQPGNARRIFKFVDRLATSNFFQYAAELSYVQKAMENLSATITLDVDIKSVVSRATINIPPPPSDRIWFGFRAPPRLWLAARPTVGDKSVDWTIVTKIIESKLCEAVNKYLVYPNMVDLSIPFLGKFSPDNTPTKN